MSSEFPFKEDYEIAKKAALEAGDELQRFYGTVFRIQEKNKGDLVTEADKASEEIILSIIQKAFPTDTILAEESGLTQTHNSNRKWYIDPLDGTTNFAHALPFFAVSIGLEVDGKLVLGMVYNPIRQEFFEAVVGSQAFLNGKRIAPSKTKKIEDSLLGSGFPYMRGPTGNNNYFEFCYLTQKTHGVRRLGAAALDLCYVAAGFLDGYWEWNLKPWDIAAGHVILETAGGKITNPKGELFDLQQGNVVASNSYLHEELIQSLVESEKRKEIFPWNFG